ncbi:MAG: amidohydrolase [Thermoanaerobaculia bacterium]|nr:amidohydrolase [Thermoanaerobaculia bacterium]
MRRATSIVTMVLTIVLGGDLAAGEALRGEIAERAEEVMPKVVEWRHDIHRHPELSNREHRTAALVAEHLRALGLDRVDTGVAHTGVVGVLVGGQPGPTVALRADMDALPVVERTGLPYASTVTTTYNGEEVGVMHACGHDAHVAILMGVAELLAGMRDELPGTVKFVFQPAEEGPPPGETGGAKLMVEEGVLEDPAPEAIFGLHVWPGPPGWVGYREGGALAAADELFITVRGRQTHGSAPWMGIDPVIAAAHVMVALQAIPSRQLDVTRAPAVVSIGSIHGGVRGNIIPDDVEMSGTVRTFDTEMRDDFLRRIRRTAENVAASFGATAEVSLGGHAPVTYNDPALTRRMVPTLEWAGGEERSGVMPRVMGAEDFSYFQRQIPGLYFVLGVNEEGVEVSEAAPNHSPLFRVNDEALVVGVRALAALAVDYLEKGG